MNVIITHVDPDGWASEYVVNKYLDTIGDLSPIARFNYNYSDNVSDIDEFIEKNLYQISDIFITDVTLPDIFMNKYAEYITHIDHHKSMVEQDKEWKHKLKHNYSKVKLDGYKGFIDLKKEYDQISACELTWKMLFPNTPMPAMIYFIGRYDVWDHNEEEFTLNLNAYINAHFGKHYNDAALFQEFDDLTVHYKFIQAIEEGKRIRKYKEMLEGVDSLRQVNKVYIFNVPVAIVNKRGITSQYYTEFLKQNPDIELMINYGYSIKDNSWKVSCYSVEGKNTSALEFIKKFYDVIPNIISLGGHDRACGFSFVKEDIINFIDIFKLNNI